VGVQGLRWLDDSECRRKVIVVVLKFLIRSSPLISILLCFFGCDGVSGGGSTHLAPTRALAGQPTELVLELSVWGTENSTIVSRYSNVVCKYRIAGEAEFVVGKMERFRQEQKKEFYRFELPSFAINDNSEIEYYMEFSFDGVANQRGSPHSPYRIPIQFKD